MLVNIYVGKRVGKKALSVSSCQHESLNSTPQIHIKNACVMAHAHTFNLSTEETEASGSLRLQASQPSLLDKLPAKKRCCLK